MAGEFDLIQWIRQQQQPGKSTLIQTGVGDDLAALKWPADDLLLVGVDQVLESVHFDSARHTPEQIGRKAMNRNLSDCAAMGCLPAAALAAVALPAGYPIEKARQLYLGMRQAADAFDCVIVGGDTASWDGRLAISVTILGRAAGMRPVTRAGARVGHGIYVTGPLGGSILGRHLTFTPRIALGRELAPLASAMIDLSDGLSRDLRHICQESRMGAVIDAALVPIHADAIELSRQDARSPLEHALHDGEDYELLFTAADEPKRGTRIGQIVADAGLWIVESDGARRPLEAKGWEHRLG
jgi:thiamine-monophosphate kinase